MDLIVILFILIFVLESIAIYTLSERIKIANDRIDGIWGFITTYVNLQPMSNEIFYKEIDTSSNSSDSFIRDDDYPECYKKAWEEFDPKDCGFSTKDPDKDN